MKFPTQIKQKQGGIALVVSLVMLTLLTLLGVSNMSSSTIDIKMAANSQAARNTFQAAFSGGNRALNDETIDFNESTTQQTRSYSYGNTSTGKALVAVTVVPKGISKGLSKEGESIGGTAGRFLHFQIKSVATYGQSTSTQYIGATKRIAGASE